MKFLENMNIIYIFTSEFNNSASGPDNNPDQNPGADWDNDLVSKFDTILGHHPINVKCLESVRMI